MGLEHINWIGSVVAAVLGFLLGALWYSNLLFAKAWIADFGFSENRLGQGHHGLIFGVAFVLMLLAAFGFSKLLGPDPSLQSGVCWGLIVGLFFACTMMGVHYAFEQRPFRLWLINGGYNVAVFLIYGLVLGLWP